MLAWYILIYLWALGGLIITCLTLTEEHDYLPLRETIRTILLCAIWPISYPVIMIGQATGLIRQINEEPDQT